MSRRIESVVLDIAGTTVNDDGLVVGAFDRAWDRLHGANGREAAHAHVLATMGQSKIEVFRGLLDEAGAQELNTEFEAALEEVIAEGAATPIAGAEDAIRILQAQGRAVVLTTGFSPATVIVLLERLGWAGLPDAVLTPADAGRGRPAPDLVLTALLRTQASAVSALAVVGDTESDMGSGVNAGAGLVAGVLTGGTSAESLQAAGAQHVLASVTELPALLEAHGR